MIIIFTIFIAVLCLVLSSLHIQMIQYTIVLMLSKFLMLQEGWHGQLLLSFCNLRSLKIKNCASLLKVLPPSLLQNLQNLEVLIVENCKQFEEVFDLEGQNVDDGPVGLLPKLEKLSLIGLPMLRHICNKDPRHILCFQNLKWLKVHKCGSLRNLFPTSMALGLMGTIIFPKLIHLSLESLPSLTSFYQAYHVLKRFDSADDIPVAVLFNEKVSSLLESFSFYFL